MRVYTIATLRRAAVISLTAALAAAAPGCFATNPHARHIAYAVEAATIVTGVLVLGFSKPGGDCLGSDHACKTRADEMSGLGLTLLFGGLAGFVVTVVSAQDAPATTTTPSVTGPTPSPEK